MPKPDTSMGSSGYPTEFYQKTTNPVRSGKVKPVAETWKKQMGIDPNSKERQRWPVSQGWREADLQAKESKIQSKLDSKKPLTENEKMFYNARMKPGAPLKEAFSGGMGFTEFTEDKARKTAATSRLYAGNKPTSAPSKPQEKKPAPASKPEAKKPAPTSKPAVAPKKPASAPAKAKGK